MARQFDLITFDCYGTLIDWEKGIVEAFQQEASRDGITLDSRRVIEHYMRAERFVESGNYQSYKAVLDQTAARAAGSLGWAMPAGRSHFLSESIGRWLPFPDTNNSLEILAGQFKLGILSNVDDDLLAATRKHFTVDFELIVTAEQVKSYKPGAAHFIEAQRRARGMRQLHAAQSYFHDVVPGKKLGITVAWVNRNGELAEAGGPLPDYEVRTLEQLAQVLVAS